MKSTPRSAAKTPRNSQHLPAGANPPRLRRCPGSTKEIGRQTGLCLLCHSAPIPDDWQRVERGLPLAPSTDARLEPYRERGRVLFEQRFGQLDLSCAYCHEQQAGRRLGGSPIPQGHATGYPIYRLEWQGLGSLQRRLRACLSGVRAEPFTWNAPELIELELYLAWRSRGMPVETPAVRP